jgi:hypothetical protein
MGAVQPLQGYRLTVLALDPDGRGLVEVGPVGDQAVMQGPDRLEASGQQGLGWRADIPVGIGKADRRAGPPIGQGASILVDIR